MASESKPPLYDPLDPAHKFAPPSQGTIAAMKARGDAAAKAAEKAQAAEVARGKGGKFAAADKAPKGGFNILHEGVGPWRKGQHVTKEEMKAHFTSDKGNLDPDIDSHIDRLVDLGAVEAL